MYAVIFVKELVTRISRWAVWNEEDDDDEQSRFLQISENHRSCIL